ncbi:hypothetical protein QWY14_02495 [Planococcus sp. N028]|uniref:DUF4871 domain-containing protein n=1 Tax=Planococcus shixiaomingii TaxID=3058393 RepID=A0ABT8MYV2_9BACL|nr:hypothetical protein [Planococcus sp. N028]MDN7240637.1 hypothetical protein [Planococcus sp. N028]
MNRFKRDMDKFIGESPRFNEALKQKILMNAKDGNTSKGSNKRGWSTFRFAAIFVLFLIGVNSFLAVTLTQDGLETPTSTSGQSGEPVKNFTDKSKNWKVTYTQKDLSAGGRDSFMTIEYIGEGPKPKEIGYRFVYKKDQELFGGSLLLNENGSYTDVGFGTCKTCILYAEDDEIPGTIEWEGQQESLVLTKTDMSKWQESPLFDSGSYTMIGEEGRVGFIYDDSEVTRFYEDKKQKYMWHFWGSQVEITGSFKVVGTHENSSDEIIVVPEGKESFLSPNNGADHHIPTHMSLPEKGMWKLEAVFNEKVIGTVYVEVHAK